MKSFALVIPKNCSEQKLIASFETVVAACGLTVASRGTLKTIPGSIHWHIKQGSDTGTLEATLEFANGRFTLTYHDNRFAEWIPSAVAKIQEHWQK